MTSSLRSRSEAPGAVGLLAEPVASWALRRGWDGLRPVQEAAIPAILDGGDVLVCAPTASGKTEAVMLPLCSMVSGGPSPGGFRVLYVVPLKALVDDLAQRVETLAEAVDMPVHRWHGDVASSARAAARRDPTGVLLITPEALEATFCRRGDEVARLLAGLKAVVVDEVHGYIGSERGAQVRSLLHRVEASIGRRVQRVGLSATVADPAIAAEFLRPGGGAQVRVVVVDPGSSEIRVQVRGYRDGTGQDGSLTADLMRHHRGSDNLVFSNSRAGVEELADTLARLSEEAGVSNEFLPHHGSLSRDLRSEAESALRDPYRTVTAICTTTLELGIDVGSVRAIGQVGAPPTVSGLRQRLGRSGRRGEAGVLRLYISEPEVPISPVARLRTHIVQSIAAVQLLLTGWLEPAPAGLRHLSTLVQQILSVISERGGASAKGIHDLLCAGEGAPFLGIAPDELTSVLRSMGSAELLEQTGDRTLVLGRKGEGIVAHHNFYAAFTTPLEYRVVGDGQELGKLPLIRSLGRGEALLFAGRRWRVEEVDDSRRLIRLRSAEDGFAPEFGGSAIAVPGRVREEMRALYASEEAPSYLDERARGLLAEARDAWADMGLAEHPLIPVGKDTLAFCWTGDTALDALVLALRSAGTDCSTEGPAIRLRGLGVTGSLRRLRVLVEDPPPRGADLVGRGPGCAREKHDHHLPPGLLAAEHASRSLDVPGAWRAIRSIVAS